MVVPQLNDLSKVPRFHRVLYVVVVLATSARAKEHTLASRYDRYHTLSTQELRAHSTRQIQEDLFRLSGISREPTGFTRTLQAFAMLDLADTAGNCH